MKDNEDRESRLLVQCKWRDEEDEGNVTGLEFHAKSSYLCEAEKDNVRLARER